MKDSRRLQSISSTLVERDTFDNAIRQDPEEEEEYHPHVVPPDGGWGWVVVAASFMCNLVVDGIIFSFGTFLPDLVDEFGATKSQISWIGSLLSGFYLISGPFVSAMVNRWDFRTVTIAGAGVSCGAFLLSSLATSVFFLYVSYGIIGGIGFGMIFMPAVISASYYFEKKRAMATGIAVCGSGIGTFVLAPFCTYLSDIYSWRGAFIIQAGFALNCAVFGALFRPLHASEEDVCSSDMTSPGSMMSTPLLQRIRKAREAEKHTWISTESFLDTPKLIRGSIAEGAGIPDKTSLLRNGTLLSEMQRRKSAADVHIQPFPNFRKPRASEPFVHGKFKLLGPQRKYLASRSNTGSKEFPQMLTMAHLDSSYLSVNSVTATNHETELSVKQKTQRRPSSSPRVRELVLSDVDEDIEKPDALGVGDDNRAKHTTNAYEITKPASEEGNTPSETGNTASEASNTTSEAGPKPTEAGNITSEVENTASEADNTTSEAFHTVSEVGNTVSEASNIVPELNVALSEVGNADTLSSTQPSIFNSIGTPDITPRYSRTDFDLVNLQTKYEESRQRRQQRRQSERDAARPFYRNDVFYSGSLAKLPQYKSATSIAQYHASVTMLPQEPRRQSVFPQATTIEDKGEDGSCVCCTAPCVNVINQLLDFSLMKSPTFLALAVGGFFTMSGFFVPFMFIADRAMLLGIPKEKAALLLSAIGITNTVARALCGILADRLSIPALVINNMALAIGGAATIVAPHIQSYEGLLAYCVVFGTSIACFASLRAVITVELLGLEKLNNAFGLLLFFQGVAATVGSPMAGAFYDVTASYNITFYIAGAMLSLSGIMLFPLPYLKRWEDKRNERMKAA